MTHGFKFSKRGVNRSHCMRHCLIHLYLGIQSHICDCHHLMMISQCCGFSYFHLCIYLLTRTSYMAFWKIMFIYYPIYLKLLVLSFFVFPAYTVFFMKPLAHVFFRGFLKDFELFCRMHGFIKYAFVITCRIIACMACIIYTVISCTDLLGVGWQGGFFYLTFTTMIIMVGIYPVDFHNIFLFCRRVQNFPCAQKYGFSFNSTSSQSPSLVDTPDSSIHWVRSVAGSC